MVYTCQSVLNSPLGGCFKKLNMANLLYTKENFSFMGESLLTKGIIRYV